MTNEQENIELNEQEITEQPMEEVVEEIVEEVAPAEEAPFDDEEALDGEVIVEEDKERFYQNKTVQLIAGASLAALVVGGTVLGIVIAKKHKEKKNERKAEKLAEMVIDKVKNVKLPRMPFGK